MTWQPHYLSPKNCPAAPLHDKSKKIKHDNHQHNKKKLSGSSSSSSSESLLNPWKPLGGAAAAARIAAATAAAAAPAPATAPAASLRLSSVAGTAVLSSSEESGEGSSRPSSESSE